jgi:hypothetical protein
MATDFMLFIHGVNTRSEGTQPTYANTLINLIKQTTPIAPLVVYWGNVNDQEEEQLRKGYQASGIWDKLWFRDLREQQLVRFAGDAALYLSRAIGAKVAALVAEQIAKLKACTAVDRLHLVTHSLGTIILFDLLFSARWDREETSGHDCVMDIRDAIYGVTGNVPDPKQGIRLGSITTMGSPIGIFSLMREDPPAVDAKSDPGEATSMDDITPRLRKLLEYLHQELRGSKLPWRNFVHPGDPIASPLEGILPHMIDEDMRYIDIQDSLVPADLAEVFKEPGPKALLDLVAEPFMQTAFAILDGGNAHSSYWQSPRVAECITQLIQPSRTL